MDGTSQLEHKKIKKVGKGFTLDLSGEKVLDEERILEVRLNRNGADPYISIPVSSVMKMHMLQNA